MYNQSIYFFEIKKGYVSETSRLESSHITPKASTHKEYCSQQIYITYFLWPGREYSPWLFNSFNTKVVEFISFSIHFVIMLFFYHYLNKKCVLPFNKCRYYTYILLQHWIREILWLLISHLISHIQFTTLERVNSMFGLHAKHHKVLFKMLNLIVQKVVICILGT